MDRSWPKLRIFRIESPSASVAPDVDTFFRLAEQALGVEGRRAIVIDLTHAKPDAARRRRLAEWIRRNAYQLEHSVVAAALIAPGPVQRGVITAVSWLVPSLIPFRVFANEADAVGWAKGKCPPVDGA